MKNFEALAVGVIAGLVVSSVCCDKKPAPKPVPPKKDEGRIPQNKCKCADKYCYVRF